ncbi:MAG: MFS transporter [Candidatus Latescibacteria bacterium]|nr:MFS transporter [Candidatus Latescibacterota bacterium]
MTSKKRGLPKKIVKIGFISLFTDMSSEMIYPLLPVFLMSLPGGGPFALGVIEGIAESTASFLKLVSGIWSDRVKQRSPFIITGYGMASLVRPLIAFASVWPVVLVFRFIDRVGKGLRSSPRDALIADSTSADRRGAAYGFHRMMDHSGAVAGPAIAAVLMGFLGFSIRQVIMFAAVPSVIVIAIVSTLRDDTKPGTGKEKASSIEKRETTHDYRLFLSAVLVFTLGNSSDAFLLMSLSYAGIGAQYLALLWSLHHIVKILGAWFGGKTSDLFGRKALMFVGFGLYALIYMAFGIIDSKLLLMGFFIFYGLSIGILEPTERAWVSELSSAGKRGSAFGFYHAAKGFGALPASLLFGFLWHQFGRFSAFFTGAGLAVAAAVILCFAGNNVLKK